MYKSCEKELTELTAWLGAWGKASQTSQHAPIRLSHPSLGHESFPCSCLCIPRSWFSVLPELLKYDRGVAKMTTGGQNPTINDIQSQKDPDPNQDFRAMGTLLSSNALLCLSSNVVLVWKLFTAAFTHRTPLPMHPLKWRRVWSSFQEYGLNLQLQLIPDLSKKKKKKVVILIPLHPQLPSNKAFIRSWQTALWYLIIFPQQPYN